jgi:hypothetical protein
MASEESRCAPPVIGRNVQGEWVHSAPSTGRMLSGPPLSFGLQQTVAFLAFSRAIHVLTRLPRLVQIHEKHGRTAVNIVIAHRI